MIALSRGMGGGSEGAKKSIQASLWAQFGVFLFHIGCRVSEPPRKLRIAALFCWPCSITRLLGAAKVCGCASSPMRYAPDALVKNRLNV